MKKIIPLPTTSHKVTHRVDGGTSIVETTFVDDNDGFTQADGFS